jgi:hypothetical protein
VSVVAVSRTVIGTANGVASHLHFSTLFVDSFLGCLYLEAISFWQQGARHPSR